jgi:hypothetical protein
MPPPIPVAARSKASVCGRALAGIVVSNPTGAWMFVSLSVCVVSRGLCDGLIPHPEESYRVWRVSECNQVIINNLYTYCEQVGRRGKDCETNNKDDSVSGSDNDDMDIDDDDSNRHKIY